MFALSLVAGPASIVWYKKDSCRSLTFQAAVVDNCYVAHFVPDYTGISDINRTDLHSL